MLNLAGMSKHGRKWVAKICAMRKKETPAQETPAEKPQPAKPQPKKQLEKPHEEKTMTTKPQPITPPEEEMPQQATPQQVPPQLTIEALQRTISQGALTTKEAATIYGTISGQAHTFTRARGGETDYLDFTLWTPQQKRAWFDTMRVFLKWCGKHTDRTNGNTRLQKWFTPRVEKMREIAAELKTA